MRFMVTVAVLMLPLSVIYAADAPDSIVGVWQLDIIRTVSEHMNNVTLPDLPTAPYGISPSQAAEMRQEEIDREVKAVVHAIEMGHRFAKWLSEDRLKTGE